MNNFKTKVEAKAKLDCPLCNVFMDYVWAGYYICPICQSMFSPYRHPSKEKWIKKKMTEKS